MQVSSIINHRKSKLVYFSLLLVAAAYFTSSVVLFVKDLKRANDMPQEKENSSADQPIHINSFPQREYKAFLERNLFAVKLQEESKGSKERGLIANLDKLALTSLNCTLVGTVVNESGDSWAIIRDNQSKKDEKVTAGSVYAEAKVVLILRNKLVLNFKGKDELLVMGIERIRADTLARKQPDDVEDIDDPFTFNMSKDIIDQSITDVSKLLTTVKIKPFLQDGKPGGFRISSLKEGSILKIMGFHNEDIVKSVNGQDIHSPEDVKTLYNTLKESDSFSISILRNNQLKTLNYTVR
ncbi:MAG: type II secretion system protein N [Desulfobacterales bacterium]|nr:type II secretion system protein N [Desulfobacterales bacterium]